MNHYKRRERGKKRYMMYVCEFRSLWEVNFLLKLSDMLMLLMAKAEVQFLFVLLTSGAIYSGVVTDPSSCLLIAMSGVVHTWYPHSHNSFNCICHVLTSMRVRHASKECKFSNYLHYSSALPVWIILLCYTVHRRQSHTLQLVASTHAVVPSKFPALWYLPAVDRQALSHNFKRIEATVTWAGKL